MISDRAFVFSTSQAITSGSADSENVADLSSVGRDLGTGQPVKVAFTVATAFAGGTSLDMKVVTDDNAALNSATTVSSLSVLTANLTAGATFTLTLPAGVDMERYLGCIFTATGTFSAGAISATLVLDELHWEAKAADRSL